jgi:CRISPR system Cascade subunit CasE
MPYLSRIWLNPLRSGTQRMLRSPQVVHAAVLGGLSRQPVDERVLWRLEMKNPHRVAVLALTQSKPSWEHLVEQGGWPGADDEQAAVRPYDPLLDGLRLGAAFAFRLRANPVSAMRRPEKPSAAQQLYLGGTERPRGVRVPHRTAAHQMAWFLDRIESWGFTVSTSRSGEPDVRLAARERLVFSKTSRGGAKNRVTLQTATFEGRLAVADVDTARRSLLEGVGPARAYGCGLLTLAPIAAAKHSC